MINSGDLILVNFYLESGCKQEDDEITIYFKPINCMLTFDGMDSLYDSIYEYLSEHTIKRETLYDILFKARIEYDGQTISSIFYETVYESID